jgi:protease stability complex PrcB-like protein
MRFVILSLAVIAALQSPPPLRTVGKGVISGIEARREAVVRSPAEWTALWKDHGSREPMPAIDLSREMVVGVFLGRRNTGGYGVEIVRAATSGGVTVVEYVETAPSPDAITSQVLTAPFHLVAVPKQDGEVSFKKVQK